MWEWVRSLCKKVRRRWIRWRVWRDFEHHQRRYVRHLLRDLESVSVMDYSVAVWAWASGQLRSAVWEALEIVGRPGDEDADGQVGRGLADEAKVKLEEMERRALEEVAAHADTLLEALLWSASRASVAWYLGEAFMDYRRERQAQQAEVERVLREVLRRR